MYAIGFNKRSTALIISVVVVVMIISGCFNLSYATLYKVPSPTQIESISSGSELNKEYFKVSTPLKTKNVIFVEGKVKTDTKRLCIRIKKHKSSSAAITVFVKPNRNGEFSIKINTKKGNKIAPTVVGGRGTVARAKDSYGTQPGYKAVPKMTSGTYHLTIAKATTTKDAKISKGTKWWNGSLGGTKGYIYKDILLTIKSGQTNNLKVVKYTAAINNNIATTALYEKNSDSDDSYQGSYVRYQDVYMKDMAFVFKNPKTGKQENLDTSKVNYIKKVADNVTSGASTDYDKLLKIYEYVASNIYYDVLANTKYKNQYANPYRNLYNLRNKKSSENSKSGKVATTCQGYASMVIAMARAEGIPARLAYGHHISQPEQVWANIKAANISKRDHWWAEAWVDGRWIVIDANAATYSKWNRTSFTKAGTWKKVTPISYVYFDPSPEMLANSYAYTGIYSGATDGKYINEKSEISQLREFLETESAYGMKNGVILNAKYSPTDFDTWGTEAADDFLTDGYGHVTHILWGNKGLAGELDLTNFRSLKYLTVYNSDLTELNLTGCSQLINISATYNDLVSFDSSASANTKSITLRGNKLSTVKFKSGSKTIAISTNNSGGTFSMNYDESNSKKLTIYVGNPSYGYKYLGIYDKEGKRISAQKEYSFNPSGTQYYVKYEAY